MVVHIALLIKQFERKSLFMKKTPLVSVIIPIFKVEKYLNRCVNSVITQQYKNIEIILVDDGSPDGCPALCDQWAERDKRIKVIHKQNGGLSDARNAGIDVSKGEFIVFIDSDDWVSIEYISSLYQAMENTNADICECEIIKTNNSILDEDDEIASNPICYSPEEALNFLIQDKMFHQYVWNKIYKRCCLTGIPFVKGKVNEDEFWTYQVFGKAKKIVKIQKKLYYYFQRPESIMGSVYGLKRLDVLEAKIERQKYIETNFPRLSSVSKANLLQSCIYSGQMILLYMKGSEYNTAITIVKQAFKEAAQQSVKLPIPMKQKIWIELAKINLLFTCRLRNLLKIGF